MKRDWKAGIEVPMLESSWERVFVEVMQRARIWLCFRKLANGNIYISMPFLTLERDKIV